MNIFCPGRSTAWATELMQQQSLRNARQCRPAISVRESVSVKSTDSDGHGPSIQKSIVHMFLPKQTPDRLQDDLQQVEEDLLVHVLTSFQTLGEDENFNKLKLNSVQVMLQTWMQLQPKSYVKKNSIPSFCSEVEGLKVGNTIPIYIRQQNCTMLISKFLLQNQERIRVQTFRTSLPTTTVMSSVDPLEMSFPETSNIIENEGMLSSNIFASHLYEMAMDNFELSMGTTEKGGSSHKETRDVPEPFLISDWAVGLLVPREDVTGLSISKKIRDQVTLASKNSREFLPFRRSGMWLSIKVALHLKLLEAFGGNQDMARLVYKLVMLRILVDACEIYGNVKDGFDLDLACQMVAKVGRRVNKSQILPRGKSKDLTSSLVERVRSTVLEHTLKVLTKFNQRIQNLWNHLALPSGKRKSLPIIRSVDELKADLLHKIDPLDKFVVKAKKLLENPEVVGEMDMERIKRDSERSMEANKKRRFTTFQSIVGSNSFNAKDQLRIWLHDVEQFIKGIQTDQHYTSQKIFDLGQDYISKARDEYRGNPLGFSQILLVNLKLACILDKIATRRYPLLLQYKPCIDPVAFDCLLLPHEQDVELLNNLLDYFNFRDERGSRSILERKVEPSSISVRYAESNPEMINLKHRIETAIQSATQSKFQEVDRVREECHELERKMRDLGGSCSCRWEYKAEQYWNRRFREYRTKIVKEKVHSCDYCPLKTTLDSKRISVKVYEVPLPPESQTHFRNAVIFELMIPEEISHLRQFLAVLKYELLGEKIFNDEANEVSKNWLDYLPLWNFRTRSTNVITLGSTVMPSSATYHLNSSSNPDLLYNANQSFIVNNGMNCHFHYNQKSSPIKNFKEECTFHLSKTTNYEPYLSLQKYLSSTEHFQNDVLANQRDCHQKLSLNEFITFGSLRAGHRIQLRNLYMAISNRSLTLEREPVLSLILQTIWQVGPRNKDGVREAHLDFKEDAFAVEFLDLLDKLVKSNESNYSIPLVLLTAIFITGRIMELNENCHARGYQLFRTWRELTKTWTEKIEDDLKTMTSNVNSKSAKNKETMQKILHEIKMCSLMTYNIYTRNVCMADQDMAHLLHTISSKHLLAQESNPSFSEFMKILGCVENLIPVRMNLDLQVTPGVKIQNQDGLSLFMKEKFPPVKDYGQYKITKASENIVMAQYSNDHCLTLDILTGEMLINGFQETELSSQISGNEEFQRFFQKHLNFRVQRQSTNVLRTSDPIHGKHYEFCTNRKKPVQMWGFQLRDLDTGNDLEIIEIPEDHPRLVLVPHGMFREFIADHFIDNYTHWLDPRLGCIYFRRLASNESDYDLPHEYILTRNERGDWLFHDEMNQQFLMSINSEGFNLLAAALHRLELCKHVNAFMNPATGTVGAHLPRHNLRFILQPDGLLESLEYPGFQVALDQDCGTLIGLRNSLLLKNGAKRNIIIPHSNIKFRPQDFKTHQVCVINRDTLSQPSFYIYEFDEVLKRIQAKKSVSSWLYLAALHASTSSPLPDPFTGMTGTEMAVNILQSARVWSDSPYDKESLEILKFIKGLNPKRNYYGHKLNPGKNPKENIETIEWPSGIPRIAAYDGYAFLVNDLIKSSVRLQRLHPVKPDCWELYKQFEKDDYSEKLLLRAYSRNMNTYNDELRLNDKTIKGRQEKLEKNDSSLILRAEKEGLQLSTMTTTAYLRHLAGVMVLVGLKCIALRKNTLLPFLFTNEALLPRTERGVSLNLANLLNLDFRPYWLRYYHLAISKSEILDHHQFSILLSALAYRGAPPEQILTLHCIRTIVDSGIVGDEFFPPVPDLPSVGNPTNIHYEESDIVKILKSYAEPFPKSYTEFDDFDDYRVAKRAYDAQIDRDCSRIASRWKIEFWPCKEIGDEQLTSLRDAHIRGISLTYVNATILIWFQARELKLVMDAVQLKVNECVEIISKIPLEEQSPLPHVPVLKTIHTSVQSQKSVVQLIGITDMIAPGELNMDGLAIEAEEIYKTGSFVGLTNADLQDKDWALRCKQKCEMKIAEIRNRIFQCLLKTVDHQILHLSGLTPRLSPTNLLKLLQDPDFDNYLLQQFIGALGVLWTHLKRLNRCLHFQLHNQKADIERELQNPGHQGWHPSDYPEWLLLELELDIMIRKVQVEVAEQMRNMPNGRNGVMQLNMGEGKTSVIVPMLCSILAKEDSLCRVTVLGSIFKMNWNILKFSIGGLLNRRVYSFPCRRDMKIDQACIEDIQATYKECMDLKGVVLALPEYRLSFRSLAYDKILKGKSAVGLKLLQTEDWLRWHARDILDESDELLSVKYQLVYTIGQQIPVDGGDVRWIMCQQILDFVQDISPEILKTHGSSLIEYETNKNAESPHEFATIRLLATKEMEKFFKNFEGLIVEKYLAGVTLTDKQMELVTEFLITKEIKKERHEEAMALLGKDPTLLNKILILAGYIHRGVLSLALSKRWRVDYGVDKNGFRKMAVPFRAKDVAAERTEFGHPDLAIILTHLSYYYSGLSDTELEEVFTILAGKLGPEAIYSDWIEKIPDKLVPLSLADYSCLNLKDAFQKSSLFDLIRKHKMVVDFWLSHVVFPRESKQFPGKLVMTASDLVYERQRLPVTGFSGTNDSIVLLPLNINQQDLPHLQGTNEKMEKVLLQPENNGHRGLGMGVSCEDILRQMKGDNLRILIDSGALMLELDNEQVAERWLDIDPDIEAAVYFNKDNELMVKTRSSGIDKNKKSSNKEASYGRGRWRHPRPQMQSETSHKVPDVPFELSPFQGKLGCCGVFLDDQHTRGTDLKFPLGSKACVTIGSRMKREKLLQACMRMRKLGQGHSVAFYLSNEANNKVTGGGVILLSTFGVLQWVKGNTKEFNDDGLLHWAIATKNYAQRLIAEDIFHFPNQQDPMKLGSYDVEKAKILAKQCVDKEVTLLREMYGQHSKFELMINLIYKWFCYAKGNIIQLNGPAPPPAEVMKRFDEIFAAVWTRCQEHVPGRRQLSSSMVMDEEQEKELELEKEAEVEEERQEERPRKVDRAIPHLHPNVEHLIVTGETFRVIEGVSRLSDIFRHTSFAKEVQPDDWSVEVYASNDLISVISQWSANYYKTDSYLRPMEYFVTNIRPDGKLQILFLSPFEVNTLLPQIRNGEARCPLRMFAARKFERQNMLLNIPRLQLPPPPSIETFCFLRSGERQMAALLLASGSLYFNNHFEQQSYAWFLSLVANWSPKCRKLLEQGKITSSGFILPDCELRRNCIPRGFQKDPMGLVPKILMCRHPVVSDVAHVVRLLEKKQYVELRKWKQAEDNGTIQREK